MTYVNHCAELEAHAEQIIKNAKLIREEVRRQQKRCYDPNSQQVLLDEEARNEIEELIERNRIEMNYPPKFLLNFTNE
jgi:hypothetical protein